MDRKYWRIAFSIPTIFVLVVPLEPLMDWIELRLYFWHPFRWKYVVFLLLLKPIRSGMSFPILLLEGEQSFYSHSNLASSWIDHQHAPLGHQVFVLLLDVESEIAMLFLTPVKEMVHNRTKIWLDCICYGRGVTNPQFIKKIKTFFIIDPMRMIVLKTDDNWIQRARWSEWPAEVLETVQ